MTEILTMREWAQVGRVCAATQLQVDVGAQAATVVRGSLVVFTHMGIPPFEGPVVVARSADSPDLPRDLEPFADIDGELVVAPRIGDIYPNSPWRVLVTPPGPSDVLPPMRGWWHR